MTTTYQIKTKNQIYKDFKAFIETALSEYGITNWNVKKLHQIIKTEELKPCIFIQILRKKQVGAEYRSQSHTSSKEVIYNTNFFGFYGSDLNPANQKPYTDGSPVRQEIITDFYSKDYCFKEEITIRFSATRRELMNDTVETTNGIDILTLIRAYFQTLNGITMFANNGYAQYRASDINEQSFTNDDENIQLMPYFDCTYLYTDSIKEQINKIDRVIENKIIGV